MKAAARKRRMAAARLMLDVRKAVPCADCGHSYPSCAMDFDHRDRTAKLKHVSLLANLGQVRLALAEADKCDVVCANCHRVRTYGPE